MKQFRDFEHSEQSCGQRTDDKYLEAWANVYKMMKTMPNDERFDIEVWGVYNENSVCNTSACIAGHAALHPWFIARGLKAKFHRVYSKIDKITVDEDSQLRVFGVVNAHYADKWQMPPPFDPDDYYYLGEEDWIEEEDDYGYPDRLTIDTEVAAQAVLDWMLQWWHTDRVKAAIDAAEAEYDMHFVHQNTPWNDEFDKEIDNRGFLKKPT